MYIRILQISEKKASAGRATCPPTSAQLAVGVVTAVVVALAVLAAVALAGVGRRHRVALTDAADALALAAARRRRVRRAASVRDRQLALSFVVVEVNFFTMVRICFSSCARQVRDQCVVKAWMLSFTPRKNVVIVLSAKIA